VRRGSRYNRITMDRYGHLFPSDDHEAAMDVIAGELMG